MRARAKSRGRGELEEGRLEKGRERLQGSVSIIRRIGQGWTEDIPDESLESEKEKVA